MHREQATNKTVKNVLEFETAKAIKGVQAWDIRLRVFFITNQTCMGIGDLGNMPNNPKFWWLRLKNLQYLFFSAVADIAKKLIIQPEQNNF